MSMRGQNIDSSIILYYTGTCEEIQTLIQGEPVDIIEFSTSSRLIVTASRRNIKVWIMLIDLAGDAQILCTLRNPGSS